MYNCFEKKGVLKKWRLWKSSFIEQFHSTLCSQLIKQILSDATFGNNRYIRKKSHSLSVRNSYWAHLIASW